MKNLKRLRLQNMMTQEELAKKCGVSRQTIVNLEKDDDKTCTAPTLMKLAKALGVRADELFILP